MKRKAAKLKAVNAIIGKLEGTSATAILQAGKIVRERWYHKAAEVKRSTRGSNLVAC